MTLLDGMKESCVMLDKTTVNDGMGGFTVAWVEGASFYAFVRKDNAAEEIVAQQQGAAEVFTVVVDKTVVLDYHDVFKRTSDNAIFRLLSSTVDDTAPSPSTVPIAKAKAERWVLP